MYKNFLLPVGLLAGTIIGAGMFSLPFVFMKSGLPLGFLILFIGGCAYTLIHLMYADIISATSGEHRFVGYAERYLGRWAFLPALFASVIEMILVLVIYLALSASFLKLLFPINGGIVGLLVFWLLGSLGIFVSVKRLAMLEFMITWGMVAIIAVIFWLGAGKVPDISIWNLTPDVYGVLTPLAPIIFALSGRVAISPLVKYFGNQKNNLRRAIVWGTMMPAAIYGLFILGILALSPDVTGDAITGLIGNISYQMIKIVGILGLLSIFSSYIVVGLDIKNILQFDLKLPFILRALAVVGAPIILYFSGFNAFHKLVALTGGIFLSLEGLFIIMMWLKVKKEYSSPTPYLLVVIFMTALVYEILKLIK